MSSEVKALLQRISADLAAVNAKCANLQADIDSISKSAQNTNIQEEQNDVNTLHKKVSSLEKTQERETYKGSTRDAGHGFS